MTLFLPSSSQKAYLYSLTEENKSIWQQNSDQLEVGLIRHGGTRYVYVWDLHKLADRISNVKSGGYNKPSVTSQYWHQIWLSEFSDDAGAAVYQPLKTLFTVNSFNKPDALKQVYAINCKFSPILTLTDASGITLSETKKGERVVYQALLCPAYPVLFASSIPHHQHFGPLFATKISISVSGESQLSPVTVSVDWLGGKSVLSPVVPVSPEAKGPNLAGDGSDASLAYRTATIQDCLMSEGVFNTLDLLVSEGNVQQIIELYDPQARVVGMSLSMSQTVTFSAPIPTPPRTDDHGPRYASVTGRSVSGKISYYSRNDTVVHPDTGSITMYFGGDFLLPMPNIEWQKPQLSVTAGSGYIHTLQFLARATDNALAHYVPGMSNSEFSIGAD